MRKLLVAAAACVVLLISGCAKTPDGYDTVKSAKEKYEQLDSAHMVMTNLNSGETMMEFSFFINSNDEMVLYYCGTSDGKQEYAYSNGAEYFYKSAEDELWNVISPDNEYYIYNIYNRGYRYPYAQGGIFFLDGTSVQTAEITDSADGCTVKYTYDAEKLNESTQGLFDNISSFSSMQTTIEINAEGFITEYTLMGDVTYTDGVADSLNVQMTVDSMNEVYDIPYPVDRVNK